MSVALSQLPFGQGIDQGCSALGRYGPLPGSVSGLLVYDRLLAKPPGAATRRLACRRRPSKRRRRQAGPTSRRQTHHRDARRDQVRVAKIKLEEVRVDQSRPAFRWWG